LYTHVTLIFYLGLFVIFGVVGYWGEGWGYFLGGLEVVLVGLLVELLYAFLHVFWFGCFVIMDGEYYFYISNLRLSFGLKTQWLNNINKRLLSSLLFQIKLQF
jgi:hypothetical protein